MIKHVIIRLSISCVAVLSGSPRPAVAPAGDGVALRPSSPAVGIPGSVGDDVSFVDGNRFPGYVTKRCDHWPLAGIWGRGRGCGDPSGHLGRRRGSTPDLCRWNQGSG